MQFLLVSEKKITTGEAAGTLSTLEEFLRVRTLMTLKML
jgi:hypothetical protein